VVIEGKGHLSGNVSEWVNKEQGKDMG